VESSKSTLARSVLELSSLELFHFDCKIELPASAHGSCALCLFLSSFSNLKGSIISQSYVLRKPSQLLIFSREQLIQERGNRSSDVSTGVRRVPETGEAPSEGERKRERERGKNETREQR
jgi:hypothetical protein